jgi:hypothetical protein
MENNTITILAQPYCWLPAPLQIQGLVLTKGNGHVPKLLTIVSKRVCNSVTSPGAILNLKTNKVEE